MATYYAIANGGFNTAAIWSLTPTGAGGAGVPTIGDIAVANSRTVSISADAACYLVTNDDRGGATASGTFNLSAVSLSASVLGGATGTNVYALNFTGTGATLIGNISGGRTSAAAAAPGARINAAGSNNCGIAALTNSVTVISGDVYASSTNRGNSNCGILLPQANNARIVVNGNCYGSPLPLIPAFAGPGSATPTICAGIGSDRSTNSFITVNGNVSGGRSFFNSGFGIYDSGSCLTTVNGDVYADYVPAIVAGAAFGGQNTGDTSLSAIINGTAYASELGVTATVVASNSAFVFVRKAVGHDAGPGSGTVGGSFAIANTVRPNAIVVVQELQCGKRGAWPVSGPVFVQPLSSSIITMKNDQLQDVPFFLSNNISGLVPAPGDVRSGVVYNQGNSTGTLVMPIPADVAQDVPTDNTVGTAVLTPEAVWNTAINTLTATSLSASIGFRLKDIATTQNVGHLIAAYNS